MHSKSKGTNELTESNPDWKLYLRSLADELAVQSKRVRNLIGDSHWLTDGHHKEYLLLSLLNRHLPTGVVASRGFVISHLNTRQRSKEQDILIVDTTIEAPLFHQSNVIISFPEAVIAAISVKSTLDKDTLLDAIAGLESVASIIGECGCWLGGYWFEIGNPIANNPGKIYEYLAHQVQEESQTNDQFFSIQNANFFCSGHDYAFEYKKNRNLQVYSCSGLATGFFLAHLLDFIAAKRKAPRIQFSELVDIAASIIPSNS